MSKASSVLMKPRIVEPPGGWEPFVASFWEQQPRHFLNPFPSLFADSEKVFRIFTKACENVREGTTQQPNKTGKVRFYLEHGQVSGGEARYLPRSDDKSLEGYSERMTKALGGRDFTLIANNAQACDFELWDRMRGFVSGLHSIVGIPLRSEIVIYASKCRETASGLHADSYSNFLFQVAGNKRFKLWPDAILVAHPHLIHGVEYDEIAGDALTIDLAPGDLLYMPSDYYHFAEGGDTLSVHVSVIINTDKDGWLQLTERLASKVFRARIRRTSCDSSLAPNWICSNEVPFNVPEPLSTMSTLFDDMTGELQKSMVEELTRLSTSSGCDLSPPLLEGDFELTDDLVVELDRRSTIAFHVFRNTLYFASNGHGFSCPAHPNAVRLIEQINHGRPCRVGWLVAEYTGTAVLADTPIELNSDGIRSLLKTLQRLRAVRRVDI